MKTVSIVLALFVVSGVLVGAAPATAQIYCPSCCSPWGDCEQGGMTCACFEYCANDGVNGKCKNHGGCICPYVVTSDPWKKASAPTATTPATANQRRNDAAEARVAGWSCAPIQGEAATAK